jgi:PadR family transcriptional regulator PadR
MKELTLSESILLSAILRLEDGAYGVTIRKQVAQMTSRTYTYGTLYSSLDQMFRKGYVIKILGSPTSERGGRGKIFYKVTGEGKEALHSARELQRAIWDGIPEFSMDKA